MLPTNPPTAVPTNGITDPIEAPTVPPIKLPKELFTFYFIA